MFGEESAVLPLFSGTPPRVQADTFTPAPVARQAHLPGLEPDWTELAQSAQKRKFRVEAEQDGEREGTFPQATLI
jgi:hypothetical protein